MSDTTRRAFVATAAATFATLPAVAQSVRPEPKKNQEPEVTPTEDLMREHGLLRRALLIYDHCSGLLRRKRSFDPAVLNDTATIIRKFVEEYHEKMEEDYLFPRFRKAQREVDLVNTLQLQHQTGRKVTTEILRLSNPEAFRNPNSQQELLRQVDWFLYLYRPHAAREDTVLFPALHHIVTEKEYDLMGDQFEDIEHKQIGEHGFEDMIGRISDIEKKLGIYDLAQFTHEPPPNWR